MDRITIPGFKFDSNYVASRLQSFPIAQALNKLQKYEDTGLQPEEVAEYVRLRDAGRIKATPCAPGDTVYVIRTRHTNQFRRTTRTYDYVCTGHPNRLRYFPESCYIDKKICTKSDLLHLGKTVFATEDAARKALEEARKNAKTD